MRDILKSSYLGVLMVGIIFIIVIPLPTWSYDILLMLSIVLGVVILLNALYSKEPLDMSLFPTILMFTTVYRLVLNVGTTRMILERGEAGQVIEQFAQYVAGGDLTIGIIIFAMIVIVNFMVITKGAERVAEVTARFTLDAMPGKQMAIDADLNTGLIDEDEAKARRKKISDEAAFYGSMDGASKFVKGDATIGILITLINMIGGTAVGMLGKGMTFEAAANQYVQLTIGDGLVSQIPALLISVAMGILVTKATSESNITTAVARQLFGSPVTLFIAGGALIFLALFGRMPWEFFIPFGLLLIFLGYQMKTRIDVRSIESEITSDDAQMEDIRRPESVVNFIALDMINLFVGYGLIPMVESSQGGDLADRIFMIRRQLALETGA
ncbi:MAG: flagellar biosynthesis protein FlhA, partial [Clostridiales bacterium]|nr:flagellar biosynthesis protein FlhA [Clostridiales bacterium]